MPNLPTNQEVSANVRAEMARVGMTQAALAAGLGMHQSRLSDRLRDNVSWRIDELTKTAELLSVPLDQLLASGEPAAT
jgi:transcriptional regulator with XRE-family HTH domain